MPRHACTEEWHGSSCCLQAAQRTAGVRRCVHARALLAPSHARPHCWTGVWGVSGVSGMGCVGWRSACAPLALLPCPPRTPPNPQHAWRAQGVTPSSAIIKAGRTLDRKMQEEFGALSVCVRACMCACKFGWGQAHIRTHPVPCHPPCYTQVLNWDKADDGQPNARASARAYLEA